MSFTSWKKEFYPVAASRVLERKALDHSIQKWKGLLPENLKRHKVELVRVLGFHPKVRGFVDGLPGKNFLRINADSCALCHHYEGVDEDGQDSDECHQCPLYQHLGTRCDSDDMPFSTFAKGMFASNPLPMIEALEIAKRKTK